MFEHKYPYGDIHELNLDYLIEEVKKVDDIAEGVDGRLTALETNMETVQGDISDINGLLETQEDEIDGLQESVAPGFSEESTYAVGDKVLYDNKLWSCDIAITEPGAWDPYHWQAVNISELIDDLGDDLETANTNIGNLDNAINGEGGILERVSANETNIGSLDTSVDNLSDSIAAEYSDQLTYNVGDVVMYNKRLRVCAQNIDTPEEWTEEHWSWIRVMSAFDDLHGQVDITNGRVTNLEKWTSAETKTVTGNPITINDGSALPAKSLSVTFEPQQDLHGYDKPWAGGAGKNKCPYDSISFTSNATWVSLTGTSASSLSDGTSISLNAGTYYISISDGSNIDNLQVSLNDVVLVNALRGSFTLESDATIKVRLKQTSTAAQTEGKIQIEIGTILTSWTPYSNECPISGLIEASADTTDGTNTNTATIQFGQTVYGGDVDFNTGIVVDGYTNITSYNSETINEPWLSSLDEYVSGTTPTTGAQVVYPKTTPTEINVAPAELGLFKGNNTVSANGETITLVYLPDTLLSEAEAESRKYTDKKISMALPTTPTSDGTYVLTCTVADSEATLSWVAQI